ncbi:putative thioesterase (plasmid) [Peptoclostridium acidaminophilum DSM 3953]|uniref:Putative thioesterase n=1 Tax=Peptoclostridium acidaminophilum DSM 3953 TaxID=1286171 RepID=W8U9K6_PEPAC|nr:thioesterase family protein [Peptoclostridium acidaminophilum]AHM57541.1 putative thioesterase [Peptoclostridium acidaminophilum DSM 3953]
MFTDSIEMSVRYAETDVMGVAHHSVYYVWFEVGRTELIKKCGMSYSQMEKEGIMLPLTESSCSYIRGLVYEEEFTLITRLEELTGAKAVFSYVIIKKESGDIAARGRTVHPFVDSKFRVVNIRKKAPRIWELLSSIAK